MLPQGLPPPIDLSMETKRAVIQGVKKVIEAYQEVGGLDNGLGYQDIIHNPITLYDFIQTFRANPKPAEKVVVGQDGKPVTREDLPLTCAVTLAQIRQLLVKTCARYYLEQRMRANEEVVTETKTRTHFLFFKKTETVAHRVGEAVDDRKLREIIRFVAFDWQLPLLDAYSELSPAHLMELDSDILALGSADGVRVVAGYDPALLRKVKQTAGPDFADMLAKQPRAIPGTAQWSRDLYVFYRNVLGDKAYDFFARDNAFFMVCASLDKPLIRIYGDLLVSVASENLEEMQRLNIDKADVLIGAMKFAFGDRISEVLGQPAFAKDVLRRLVESLIHLSQEKDQLAISAQLTCKAIAPQVMEWLAKQPPLPSTNTMSQ